MAIREKVSLYNRYDKDIIGTVKTFRTYYLIMEGTKTEPSYFSLLEKRLNEQKNRNNIKIVYLERTLNDRGSNSPKQLYNFIKSFRNEKIDEDAYYYMIFDRDSYKNHLDPKSSYLNFLNSVKGSKVRLIVTSPCFEIWIMLHKENSFSINLLKNKEEVFLNKRISPGYTYMSKMVKDELGFNPKSMISEDLLNDLDIAMRQSKLLTSDIYEMAGVMGENVSDFIMELITDKRLL